MSRAIEGIAAAPGKAIAPAWRGGWKLPPVAHRTIEPREVPKEVGRFHAARASALEEVRRLGAATLERFGVFEGKVFESQAMMIEDPDLVDGTLSYITQNFLSAERAFDWRILELRVGFLNSPHAMALDRLVDLEDVRSRVLGELLGLKEPGMSPEAVKGPVILVADEVTPSQAAQLDPKHVLGFVAGGGSRGSHSVLLARSLGIPAVVGVGHRIDEIAEGVTLLIDGGSGRLIVDPSAEHVKKLRMATERASERRARLVLRVGHPTTTADGVAIVVDANLDQPEEAQAARRLGARAIGLFRSEFLVIGRRSIPGEQEQYETYREVVEAFPKHGVTLRTFDIGGDKFPMFLSMPPDENPYLGWRAIRVCLDLPELFGNQLRAAVRAAAHGKLRILLPFISSVDEVRRTRELLREIQVSVGGEGGPVELGVMIEIPAAIETLDLIAPYVDFLSLGTNDLTQYVLAVDRGSARLASLYDPLHPALFRMYGRLVREAGRWDLDLSVCGELAGDPVGAGVLLGLGYRHFSVGLACLPEIQEVVRSVSCADLKAVCDDLSEAESGEQIRSSVESYLGTRDGFDGAAASSL